MIEIRNISKIYRKGNSVFTALDDINFKIEKGDFCTVIGPSGAGKSTLLHIIGGLIQPDKGTVLFNGVNIYSQNRKYKDLYRKKHVGFMFQQFHLMPYLTVTDNIRLACHNRIGHSAIDTYLRRCSLFEMKNKYPSELSVGEKQRTAFIRAIISNPDFLLADEPTGNLDPVNSSILMSLVNEYRQNNGTVVIVSHDPLIAENSSRSIALEKGKIVS
jgi:putative ABC transport system ATP-binding protein